MNTLLSIPSQSHTNMIDFINSSPRKKLKELTSTDIKKIIANLGQTPSPADKKTYITFAKRFHHIQGKAAVLLLKWLVFHASPKDVSLVLNTLKPKYLTRTLNTEFKMSAKVLRKKTTREHKSIQDKLFMKSVSRGINLLSLNKSQFQEWLKSSNRDAYLESISDHPSPLPTESVQKVLQKYGKKNQKTFEVFLFYRRERLTRLAECQVFQAKWQREKEMVDAFLEALDTAVSDEQIVDAVEYIVTEIQEIKVDEATYLSKPGAFAYSSHINNQDCEDLRAILLNDQTTHSEKVLSIKALFVVIAEEQEESLKYVINRIKLFEIDKGS